MLKIYVRGARKNVRAMRNNLAHSVRGLPNPYRGYLTN